MNNPTLTRIQGFIPYLLMLFLNAFVDLGHKIVVQNTVFKLYDGQTQIILTAIVNSLILLPFIFLFSPAGFLSDKYPKHKVMQVSAWVALVATGLITFSYYAGWFWVAFGLTLLLAIQSAIYSPAKYGYIRELVGSSSLASANGAVQATTIIAILLGTFVFSGLFEGLLGLGEWHNSHDVMMLIAPLGWGLMGLTLCELVLAYRLPARSSQRAEQQFSMASYARGEYLRHNITTLRSHRIIRLSIIGLAIFWALSQSMLAIFPAFAKETLAETNTVVIQGLLACSGIGIVLGSLIAGRASRRHIELGLIPLGALGIALTLAIMPFTASRMAMALTFMAIGICGGLLIVPLNSLIQYHAPARQLGTILAGNNWIQNLVMVGFLVVSVAAAALGINSQLMLLGLAVIALLATGFAIQQLPQSLARILASIIFRGRYRIHVLGFENLPANGPVLLLGNHISWIDWALVQIASPRPVRFVMLRSIYNQPLLKPIFRAFGVIPIASGSASEALESINAALKNGEVVCLFPEGAISRNGQLGEFKRGYERTVAEVDGVIVPFYLHGLWGSRFSRAQTGINSGQPRLKRELFVAFGEALPMTTTAEQLKQKVFELSVSAWSDYTRRLPTVPEAFIRNAKQSPLQTAAVDTLTRQPVRNLKLLTLVLLLARVIRQRTTHQEQHVGILLPSSSMAIATNLAVMLRGKAAVNLNYTASSEAFRQALEKADIRTVITSDNFLKKLRSKGIDIESTLQHVELISLESLAQQFSKLSLAGFAAAALLLPTRLLMALCGREQAIDQCAAILFSSGSEGSPKGVMLSHRNLMSNVKQISAMLDTRDNDVIMGGLPPFHSFGLTVTTLLPVIEGVPVVCHPDPTDALAMAKAIARYQATILCGTATFLRLYSKNRRVEPLMLESLRVVVAGAEKLQPEVRDTFERKFNKTIYEGYGATETTPVASVNIPDKLDPGSWKIQQGNRPGTVGLPVPGSGFRIVDPVSLEPLPIGEDGLVLIAGNQVMLGYLNDAEKTAEVIVELDGQRWYKSGDKGHLDQDGFLTIVDRYSRFAKIGGEMISLQAVEQATLTALQPLDDKIEVMAVALADEKKGEKIALLVATQLAEDALQQGLRSSDMNNLMQPSLIMITAELPVLGSGKPDVQTARQFILQAQSS